MLYVMRIPSAPLAPFVESFWYFAGSFASELESVLPDGSMRLLVNLDADELRWYTGADYATRKSVEGAAMCGCRESHFAIDVADQRRIVGVTFKPGGAAPFLPVPAHELREVNVPLTDLWPRGAEVREELLERAGSPAVVLEKVERVLLARLDERVLGDSAIPWAIEALGRGERVSAVVGQLGWSPHRFLQRFQAYVGLKPKTFQRISRFSRAVEMGERGEWADVAARVGYTDQAHLIRDFREFAGTTPAAFARPDIPTPERITRDP